MEIWKDKNYNFLDYDEMDDKCINNEFCQNNFEDLIKRKAKDNNEEIYQSVSNNFLFSFININEKKIRTLWEKRQRDWHLIIILHDRCLVRVVSNFAFSI